MKDLMPRIISGTIYVILIVIGTTINPWLFAGLMALFMLMCYIEFVKLTELKDKFYLLISFIGIGVIFYYFSDYLFGGLSAFYKNSMNFAGPVLFILACYVILFSNEELKSEFGKSTVAVIYTAVPFSLALTIPRMQMEFGKENMTKEILYIFILIWISDIMAYVIGSLWGKRKLAPSISAGKSWEGAIGGFLFTIITGWILQNFFSTGTHVNWLIIGVIVAFCAPIGDLIESKLKRVFNVKDSGNLIPGHGGFLDRLDSFIFVIPMVYLYLLIKAII